MSKLKIWLVRRWLHLISLEELDKYTKQRFFYESMNTAYDKLVQSMVELYYKEGKEKD